MFSAAFLCLLPAMKGDFYLFFVVSGSFDGNDLDFVKFNLTSSAHESHLQNCFS